jgi:vacuolar protein-sorting-associated protein 4
MQGVGNDNDGILVLGASNVPWELDPAIRRRFEKRIYIPLPDVHARISQFKIRLGKTPNNLTEEDYINLGQGCEGYSGSDITVVVKEAMMMPVRRCQTAQKFRKTPDGFFEPTYPSDPAGIDMNLFQVEPSKLKAPDITVDDFYQALARIKPSVC